MAMRGLPRAWKRAPQNKIEIRAGLARDIDGLLQH